MREPFRVRPDGLALPLVMAVSLAFPLASCSTRTAGFDRAYTALDSLGNRRRDAFFVDTDTIYCIAEVASGRADVTVQAKIKSTRRYDPGSGRLVPYEEVYAQAENAPGKTDKTVVAFLMPKLPGQSPDGPPPAGIPYSAGTYACELSIDGELQETLGFSINYPTCPAVPITAGALCSGWSLPGTRCPGQTPGQTCTCANSGLWACE